MIALYDNKVLDASISRSTEHPNYSFITALRDTRLSRVGRSASSEDWIKMTFSAVETVDYVIIINHNFGSGATVTLEASATDDFVTPDYTTSLTVDEIIVEKIEEDYQYWRLVVNNPGAGYVQVGYIFLGPATIMPGMEQSQVFNMNTTSTANKSITRQLYGNRGGIYKAVEIQFPYITNTERTAIKTMFEDVDIVKPWVVLFWENNLDVEAPAYVNFVGAPSFKRVRSSAPFWSVTIQIEECG